MSSDEHIERIREDFDVQRNYMCAHSNDTTNRHGRKIWSRFRLIFNRSRGRDEPRVESLDRNKQRRDGTRGQFCLSRGRRLEKSDENSSSNGRRRGPLWKSVRDRFRRLSRRSNRSASNISEESNITIDIDGHRREDSPVIPRQSRNVCHHEGGCSGNNESTSGCLILRSSSKEIAKCCIPRLISKVINCTWYWGNIDRFEAAVALQTKADGYFLLRKSAHPEYLFTISFKRFNKTMHVRIETGYDPSESVEETPEDAIFFPWILSGKFSPTYTRLLELLDHCDEPFYGSINSMPLLVCPLYRESPFSLKHLARAAVYKWCNYHSIDSLEIPEELKLFLKEFGYVCKSNSLSSMSQFFNG